MQLGLLSPIRFVNPTITQRIFNHSEWLWNWGSKEFVVIENPPIALYLKSNGISSSKRLVVEQKKATSFFQTLSKAILCATLIFPLLAFIVKCAGRIFYTFNKVDPIELQQKSLEKNNFLSKEEIEKVEKALPFVLEGKNEKGIFFKERHFVKEFTIDGLDHLVFNVSKNEKRWGSEMMFLDLKENLEIETTRAQNGLNQLVIPKEMLFSITIKGKEYFILAKEKIKAPQKYAEYREAFDKEEMKEAICQLVKLSILSEKYLFFTKLIPLSLNGHFCQIGLADTRVMDQTPRSNEMPIKWLINQLPARWTQLILEEAQKLKASIPESETIKNKRAEKEQFEQQFCQFLNQNALEPGSEKLQNLVFNMNRIVFWKEPYPI